MGDALLGHDGHFLDGVQVVGLVEAVFTGLPAEEVQVRGLVEHLAGHDIGQMLALDEQRHGVVVQSMGAAVAHERAFVQVVQNVLVALPAVCQSDRVDPVELGAHALPAVCGEKMARVVTDSGGYARDHVEIIHKLLQHGDVDELIKSVLHDGCLNFS